MNAEDNPYRAPGTASQPGGEHAAGDRARRRCPLCHRHEFPYWRLYWFHSQLGRHLVCPACGGKLKVAKFGFGKWSSLVIALPSGFIGGFTLIKLLHGIPPPLAPISGLFTPPIFLAVFLATGAMDFFLDRFYCYLRPVEPSSNRSTSSSPGNPKE
jgi:hypothetical protein